MTGSKPQISLISAMLLLVVAPAPAFSKVENPVSRTVVMDASLETVYAAIQATRTIGGRKLLSYKDKKAVIADTLRGIPIVGSSWCKFQETEVSPTRIDYTCLDSEKLSTVDGSWILAPRDNNKTQVTLTMAAGCHIPVPFAGLVVTQYEKKIVNERLKEVETTAHRRGSTASAGEQTNK